MLKLLCHHLTSKHSYLHQRYYLTSHSFWCLVFIFNHVSNLTSTHIKNSHIHSLRITVHSLDFMPSIIALIYQLFYSDIYIPSTQTNLWNACKVSFSTNCCVINISDHIILLDNLFPRGLQMCVYNTVNPKHLSLPTWPTILSKSLRLSNSCWLSRLLSDPTWSVM